MLVAGEPPSLCPGDEKVGKVEADLLRMLMLTLSPGQGSDQAELFKGGKTSTMKCMCNAGSLISSLWKSKEEEEVGLEFDMKVSYRVHAGGHIAGLG